MKKILLLLFSLLLSFNSYGDWIKLFTHEDGTTWHINIETIKERDGYVYLWQMNSDNETSSSILSQNDCDLVRTKYIQLFSYTEPMLKGVSTNLTEMDWVFLPPDTISEFMLQLACDLAPKSLEEREELVSQLTRFFKSAMEEEVQANLTDKQKFLKTSWVDGIAARVKSFWRYQGAEDDWECEVYVVQDRDGTVVAVDVRNCNVDDSNRAKVFKDSVRRAVYKASPLPSAPDEAVFDKELVIKFSVN